MAIDPAPCMSGSMTKADAAVPSSLKAVSTSPTHSQLHSRASRASVPLIGFARLCGHR